MSSQAEEFDPVDYDTPLVQPAIQPDSEKLRTYAAYIRRMAADAPTTTTSEGRAVTDAARLALERIAIDLDGFCPVEAPTPAPTMTTTLDDL